ncbi:MAG: acetoacetate decarboxylase family protein [bacterium]|nr:acetoacetate decarboxylase family protein [bacterium]
MGTVSPSKDGGASARQFEIEGRTLGFPALFQDGSSSVGMFTVPASAAQALIQDSGFEVAEPWPGRAIFTLACCHYRESDCGVYNEIAMSFFVKPRHGNPSRIPYIGTWLDIVRNDSATYTWRLPVTTKLANDAGVLMWGFPKTIDEIDFEVRGGRAIFDLHVDGRHVLSYSVAATGKREQPASASPVYTNYEGAPHVTFLGNRYRDVGTSLGGGRLTLGDHPIANELRGLGLPRRPLLASWMGQLAFEVGAPQKL